MSNYLTKKIIHFIVVLFGVLTLVFFLMRVSGSPINYYIDYTLSDEEIAYQQKEINKLYGFDKPLFIQWYVYMGKILQGDFGESFRYGVPAFEIVLEKLPYSLILALLAIIFSIILGLPLGIISAEFRGKYIDNVTTVFAITGIAIPNFFLGIILIYTFSVTLKLLPSSGSNNFLNLILPVITQSTGLLALITRLTRSSYLEVINEDYVRTARSKGLNNTIIIRRHILKNTLLPIITVISLAIPAFIGYMVVVETLFAWPGIGNLLLKSVSNRDYPIVICSVFILCTITLSIFFVTDILYSIIDPRIKF